MCRLGEGLDLPSMQVIMDVSRPYSSGKEHQLMCQEVHWDIKQCPAVWQSLQQPIALQHSTGLKSCHQVLRLTVAASQTVIGWHITSKDIMWRSEDAVKQRLVLIALVHETLQRVLRRGGKGRGDSNLPARCHPLDGRRVQQMVTYCVLYCTYDVVHEAPCTDITTFGNRWRAAAFIYNTFLVVKQIL